MPRKERDSSIELLRIICMVLIIFHHFAIHGGFDITYMENIGINQLWYRCMVMGGKIGVNIFILITGYFLSTRQDIVFDLRKICKLEGQLIFYSIIITAIFYIAGDTEKMGTLAWIKLCFPITYSYWWFGSCYFILFLIHPFLNRLLFNLKKNEFQKLLVLLIVFWSIIPTFLGSAYQGNNLIWFICLYCIAAYINQYGFNPKFNNYFYIIGAVCLVVLNYGTTVLYSIKGLYMWNFFNQERTSILLFSICLFMIFKNLNLGNRPMINRIASGTFGVYLIHDHNLIRPFLWEVLFKNATFQESKFLFIYSICVVLAVYIVCYMFEIVRQLTVEQWYMKIVDYCLPYFINTINFLYRNIINIVFGT